MRRRWLLLVVIAHLAGGVPAAADRGRFGDELSRPHWGRDRTVDVLHYRLDVSFDPAAGEVHGTVSVRATPINDGLAEIALDAGPMEIQAVTLGPGEGGGGDLPFRHDGESLRIELPRSYRQGEEIHVTIRYAARPRAGLYFVGPDEAYPDKPAQVWSQGETEYNHLWFPSFDYPNDRATSETIYTVPEGWTAVGNGELVEVVEADAGGTSFHYRMDVPHVSYLVSVVAGRFETYTDDFDGTPVEYHVPEGTGRERALRSFGPTPDMLRFFSERTGVRYPYAKYAQSCAVDFIFGGMENISATTQTVETLHDQRAALEVDSWGLVAHEAAHQWWGNLLTCASWSHAWLNEGFATYWENLWREEAQGRDEFLYHMFQDRESYLREDRDDYRRAIVTHHYTEPFDVFDSHLYPKGAWVLHMIRGILGDELFFKSMQHYARTYREKVVETGDFRRAIADATGVDLSWFFDQWLYHGGHPELQVRRRWDPDQSVLELQLRQTQEVDDLTPVFRFPLRIAVETDRGTVRRTVEMSRVAQDVTLELPAEPRLVRIDPEFHVLMELDHERRPEEILLALRTDPNPVGRILAARDLAAGAPREIAAAGLAGAVGGDPFYGVRIQAAGALGDVRGGVARDALIAALSDDDARVRTAAATSLGEFRDDDVAAAALSGILDAEPAYGTVAAAVLSLARIDAADAGDAARKALEMPSHGDRIQAAGLRALAELDDPGDVGTLREWTAYGRPPRARLAAIESMVEMASGDRRDEVIEDLVELLDDPYIWARREAMRGLGKLRATEAMAALRRSAKVETDTRLRRDARKALREISSEAAADSTVEELSVEVERLRQELAAQADRIGELEKGGP